MSEPSIYESTEQLAAEQYRLKQEGWAGRLVLFLRAVAVTSLAKGLYHWAAICGFAQGAGGGFEAQSSSWQIATVFFAIIDLIAAVGLWISAPWGVIIWLASTVTMIIVSLFFPQIYGFQPAIVGGGILLVAGYVFIAIQTMREQPVR